MGDRGWAVGDHFGLPFPAHPQAFLEAGADFLTRAFRAAGGVLAGQGVARILRAVEVSGGSTGRKLALDVAWEEPAPDLPTELFVKFSRDFADPLRDGGRVQMEREVHFALLARRPDFPVAVPACLFADYQAATGSGILITERIPFGRPPVEPHYPKALDHRMPEVLAHYRTLVRALARLAGWDRAGRLGEMPARHLPLVREQLAVSDRAVPSAAEAARRAEALAAFLAARPALFSPRLRAPAFRARLVAEAPRVAASFSAIFDALAAEEALVGLSHWNAHVDNAWFWRDDRGELQCGLFDWGNASRLHLAMALWGCLSAAPLSLWEAHLEELLALAAETFHAAGGEAVEPALLRARLCLYAAAMGVAWLLAVPQTLERRLPGLTDPGDPRLEEDERARSQLAILTSALHLWESADLTALLDALPGPASARSRSLCP
ncbi:MAG: hypothetical protein KatS3mg124_0656 [Porticoccaceae bacterium]|nr:MAG: hypothetical protein KatS3mg124_0656 [Porticoccaceae bacterium]